MPSAVFAATIFFSTGGSVASQSRSAAYAFSAQAIASGRADAGFGSVSPSGTTPARMRSTWAGVKGGAPSVPST